MWYGGGGGGDDGGGDAGGNGGEYDLSMQRVGGWTVMHARRKAT